MATTFRGVRFAILILAGLLAGVAGPARADEESAKNFVTQLGNEAVSILKPENSTDQRQQALVGLFRKAFDFDTIGRAVVGQYWNKATPEQQAEYRKVFEDYVVTTYARRLAPFTLSGFSISGAKGVGKQDILVETVIERPDDPPLNYAWRVREGDGGSKLVDVVVEGVSLTITHRADFASVLQRDGMDGLIATLKQKLS
jgi:phospholipid transport system substrate-binding protein